MDSKGAFLPRVTTEKERAQLLEHCFLLTHHSACLLPWVYVEAQHTAQYSEHPGLFLVILVTWWECMCVVPTVARRGQQLTAVWHEC